MQGAAEPGAASTSLARSVRREGNILISTIEPLGPAESVGGLLARNRRRFADRPMVRERVGDALVSVTWEEFAREVFRLASFLGARGVVAGDRIAVVSRNRREMLTTEFAVMSLGAVHTPIFHAYTSEQVQSLVEQAGARVAFVGGEQLSKVCGTSLDLIVCYDPLSAVESGGEGVVELERVVAREPGEHVGDADLEEFLRRAANVDRHAACLMMYTSGTSGRQKGVLLSHDNILSQQRALARVWSVTPEDRLMTYLPWHHSFGGIFEKYTALYNGATLTLDDSYGKDFDRLLRNWRAIKPTIYFSVPKIHQQLVSHVQMHPEDEADVFHDELRFVFTAAAPLPAKISEFLAGKGIAVVEGWGLTETAPCCTLTDMGEARTVPGMVGYPIPGVALKLAPDGEILVRGDNVMLGYHEDPEASARCLPGDGWFRTGDLGEFVDRGLKLVTRKDRVFKMLNAEKVVPTILENRLAGLNEYIQHVLIVGDGRSSLAALVFLDLFRIREEFGEDLERASDVVKTSLVDTIRRFNEENPVKYERLRAFAVIDRELTVENHELTPSLKVRVRNVLENMEQFVDAIYDPLDDCDCRFLRKVLRLEPDGRPCMRGKDATLDRCHECGQLIDMQAG
jgi:long-subunit acyl-CoA synthetase (AMP-forming)